MWWSWSSSPPRISRSESSRHVVVGIRNWDWDKDSDRLGLGGSSCSAAMTGTASSSWCASGSSQRPKLGSSTTSTFSGTTSLVGASGITSPASPSCSFCGSGEMNLTFSCTASLSSLQVLYRRDLHWFYRLEILDAFCYWFLFVRHVWCINQCFSDRIFRLCWPRCIESGGRLLEGPERYQAEED